MLLNNNNLAYFSVRTIILTLFYYICQDKSSFMNNREISRIYTSMIEELYERDDYSYDKYGPDEITCEWIRDRIFIRKEPFPKQSILSTCQDVFEKYLGTLTIPELRDILRYSFLLSWGKSYDDTSSKDSIAAFCSEVLENNKRELIVEIPLEEKFLQIDVESIFPNSKIYYVASSSYNTAKNYQYQLSEECGHVDVIVGNIDLVPVKMPWIRNRILYGSPEIGTMFLGIGEVRDKNIGKGWCGSKRQRELTKTIHQRQLCSFDVSFFQKGNYLLELLLPRECPNPGRQTMHMVDMDNNKDYVVPFDEVESFLPSYYSNNPKYYSAEQHFERAKRCLREIEMRLESNRSYSAAWNEIDILRQIRVYLEGFRTNTSKQGKRILDDRYQAEKQCEMHAIAAAISYRLNLFIYKTKYCEIIPTAKTDDFESFILGEDSNWKPGHYFEPQPARTVVYIWELWREIFYFPDVRWASDDDSKTRKVENQLRQRVYDNKFSKSLKKRIAEVMLNVEQAHRDLFPLEQFPDIKL